MYRRSKTIPRVAIELREEYWATEFRDWLPTFSRYVMTLAELFLGLENRLFLCHHHDRVSYSREHQKRSSMFWLGRPLITNTKQYNCFIYKTLRWRARQVTPKRIYRKVLRSNPCLRRLRFMAVVLTYRGRAVTQDEVAFIQALIAEHPTASRRRLSEILCRAWNWVQPNGALRDMVCRGLMLALHRGGQIELPARRWHPCNPLAHRSRPEPIVLDESPIRSTLQALQPIMFRQVRRTKDEATFNA